MPRRCKQSGQREELGESWEEFLAEDDEETERALRSHPEPRRWRGTSQGRSAFSWFHLRGHKSRTMPVGLRVTSWRIERFLASLGMTNLER